MTRATASRSLALVLGAAAALSAPACGGRTRQPARAVIQNKGSDTMVNVAQIWAEEYRKVVPDVEVEVSGGGSGVGLAALIKGAVDLANSSRDIKPGEVELALKSTGQRPKGVIVGFDALAVFVHKDNPIAEISFEQLARVFAQAWDARDGLLLVDEPVAALDPGLSVSLMVAMSDFAAARGHALVAVLHDLNLALNHFDRLWLLKAGRMLADCDALPSTLPLLEQLYDTRLRLLADDHGLAILPLLGHPTGARA